MYLEFIFSIHFAHSVKRQKKKIIKINLDPFMLEITYLTLMTAGKCKNVCVLRYCPYKWNTKDEVHRF